MCVTQHKGKTNVEKPTEFFYIKIKYQVHNQLSIKKKYIYIYILKLYIHPAETHRLLKFLFHIMGRLVPAHKKTHFNFVYFTQYEQFDIKYLFINTVVRSLRKKNPAVLHFHITFMKKIPLRMPRLF